MPGDTLMTEVVIRRELRAGDAEGIVGLQQRLYGEEHGLDERFRIEVDASVQAAIAGGWPASSGAVWLVDRGDHLSGSLALTQESPTLGQLRWFLLAPELRGMGLGRSLIAELLSEARAAGIHKLVLNTFSVLRAAAHIYRDAGFRLVSERESEHWGPRIVYQNYELQLR
jgi:GNAT superfamily N-acetyltransferase